VIGLRMSRLGSLLIVALVSAVVWVFAARGTQAHGGGVPQLTNAEAGPYWVSAWTQPDPLRVGKAHITVAVSEPGESGSGLREAGSAVLDALVQVQFKPLEGGGETLAVSATHENAANKIFYEADLELPETGRWQVDVSIEGPDGSGSASFDTRVSPPSTVNWALVGGLGLFALTGVWVVQRYWGQRGRA
jgi:hypothetical protein